MGAGTLAFALARVGQGTVGAPAADEGLAEIAHDIVRSRLRLGETAEVVGGVLAVQVRRGPLRRRAVRLHAYLHDSMVAGEHGALVIGTGIASGSSPADADRAHTHAVASLRAGDHMPLPDLALRGRKVSVSSWHTASQVVATYVLLALAVPFLAFALFALLGWDVAGAILPVVTGAIALMAVLVWAETLASLPRRPRPHPVLSPPSATAIVAAYLPNEAGTVIDTLTALRDQRYGGPLQVLLAYNTPRPLPVEEELARICAADRRVQAIRVHGSASKAENINAVLPAVTGEFVGIFDADHQPQPDVFTRAAEWLAAGADVVQGRCAVRNDTVSTTASVVACEFEAIYGISHPGRQRVYGFGVFGGSNGFWRTSDLRRLRMRPAYLTEDIEPSVRAVREGLVVVNDPRIVSRELAPTRLAALWRQRLRWAQGWLQVTCRHLHGVATTHGMPARTRIGMTFLLGWREVFPWLSALVLPTLLFLGWQGRLAEIGVLGLLALLVSWSAGPAQAIVAWSRSLPEQRQRTAAWVQFVLLSPLYQEWRDLVMRVAVLKQFRGERHWAVTPRSSLPRPTPAAPEPRPAPLQPPVTAPEPLPSPLQPAGAEAAAGA